MTLDEFRAKVDAVKRLGDTDPESSHGTTDGLVEEALRALVADGEDSDAIAKGLLAVDLLDFVERERLRRWYA